MSNEMAGSPGPIFVWGAPRSGTTLVYNLLASLSRLRCPVDASGRPREGTDIWWSVFGEQRGVMDRALVTPDRIDAIRAAYRAAVKGLDTGRLLDKTPFMTLWVPAVERVFPHARHVHVVRDGRAVVNSVLFKLRHSTRPEDAVFQRGAVFFGPQPPSLGAPFDEPEARRHGMQWVGCVERGMAAQALLQDRYHEVRYESLVAAPRQVIGALCAALGEPVDDNWLNAHVPQSLPNKNALWSDPQRHVDDPVFTRHGSLTPDDFQQLAVMNPLLGRLGYEVSNERPSSEGFDKYRFAGAYHWTQARWGWGNRLFNAPLVARYQSLVRRIDANRQPLRILDVGCGDGYLLHLAGKRAAHAELCGIDNEPLGIELARDQLAKHGQSAELRHGNAGDLPWPDRHFDVVVLADVIEHIRDAETCLREAARVLREGGDLLLSTPNRQPGQSWDERHVHEYDAAELQHLVGKYFQGVTVRLSWPMRWLRRWRADGRARRWNRRWIGWMCRLGHNPFLAESAVASEAWGQLIAHGRGPIRGKMEG